MGLVGVVNRCLLFDPLWQKISRKSLKTIKNKGTENIGVGSRMQWSRGIDFWKSLHKFITLMLSSCIDNRWTGREYSIFKQKYRIKQLKSSQSKANEMGRWVNFAQFTQLVKRKSVLWHYPRMRLSIFHLISEATSPDTGFLLTSQRHCSFGEPQKRRFNDPIPKFSLKRRFLVHFRWFYRIKVPVWSGKSQIERVIWRRERPSLFYRVIQEEENSWVIFRVHRMSSILLIIALLM